MQQTGNGGARGVARSGVARTRVPRLGRVLALVGVVLGTALANAASAQVSSFSVAISIGGPSSVTPGDTGLPGSLSLTNTSVGLGPATLTSITFHPSCADFTTACTSPESGVFTLGGAAIGGAGTGCANRVFAVSADGAGRYTFAASPPITLATSGTGSGCTIGFTFSVLRVPTTDSRPPDPGVQTTRSAIVQGTATATGGGTVNGTSRSIASITVIPVQTSIATQVSSASIDFGASVTDTATITGAPNVAITGNVTFDLFGPNDANCFAAPVFSSVVAVAGNTATSAPATPPSPGVYRFKARYSGDVNNFAVNGVCNAPNETVTVLAGPTGRYHPLTPARILDTRTGTGGLPGAIGPDSTTSVQITGRGGVPASGVIAVAVNVTVTEPTAPSYLTLFPTGSVRPLAANLNFTPGKTVPNLVVVKLGTGGKVDMYNPAGSTHVIYDVAGWFSDVPTGNDGRFQPLTPVRILDTRNGTGGSSVRLGPGASLELQVTGVGGVPATGAAAVVVNVAVTSTTEPSYLTVHPTGEARPLAANLNWVGGDTAGNRVFAKLGAGGKVTLFNAAGLTDVIVDVNGWFTDASQVGTPGAYAPLTPARILDTRIGTGGIGTRPAGSTVEVQITGRGGVPATGVSAVVLNVTVVSPAGPGYFTLFPAGTTQPLASDLNYAGGETRPNLVVVKVGTGGRVSLFTPTGADVVFDVAGYVA